MACLIAMAHGAEFARGADVSWLTEMEASGKLFYNDAGVKSDVLQVLKDHSLNSIRLRVWVNPTNGWSARKDVITKAVRAKAMGYRIMIDFHYSDTWADPAQQTIPAAWTTTTISALTSNVYLHTLDVLTALDSAGVTPEWVQIGNETNDGMLWQTGRASVTMANFARLIDTGYAAVKKVNPKTKVIVHISNANDNVLFRWIFDGLKSNNARWDVVGMSLYPEATTWDSLGALALNNMNDMVSRYGKDVMLVEIGMDYTQVQASKSFIESMIARVGSVTGRHGLGVFWWEPQCYNWQGYTKGTWGLDGKPTIALDGFLLSSSSTVVSSSALLSSSSKISSSSVAASSSSSPTAIQKSASPSVFSHLYQRLYDLLGRSRSE